MTKQQCLMIKLALYNHGTPVAGRKWISDGFDKQYTDRDVLYYNVDNGRGGEDTKVMVRSVREC